MSQPASLSPSSTGAELHAACRSGDPSQQQAAYHILWAYLFRIVHHILRGEPNPTDLAADVTQQALVRVHTRLHECHTPGAFRGWCRRIAVNLALDEVRRRRRFVPEEEGDGNIGAPSPEADVVARLHVEELRALLTQAPISARSRRVVVGRYLDDAPDERLAAQETELTGRPVLPSHIQVTRSKNLAKLRRWPALRTFLGRGEQGEQ